MGTYMSGLVSQLQSDAIDQSVPLTTLLRKVKLAAVKLSLPDALEWVDAELSGYEQKPPEYRIVHGRLKWLNPYQGYLHVGFQDNKTAEKFETWPVPEAITSLESTLETKDGTYVLQMPPVVTHALSQNFGVSVTSAILEVPRGALVGIIEHVRGLALNWALELERAGVTGEGMSFSPQEQQIAKSAHISIGSFQGTFNTGDLSGSNARINTSSTDRSSNIAASDSLFQDLRAAIEEGVKNAHEQAIILRDLEDLQSSTNRDSRLAAYRKFVSDAANHMTILAPFIPALSALLL